MYKLSYLDKKLEKGHVRSIYLGYRDDQIKLKSQIHLGGNTTILQTIRDEPDLFPVFLLWNTSDGQEHFGLITNEKEENAS